MATCEACGNDYDKAFEVVAAGERHTFDSFESAIVTHRMPLAEAAEAHATFQAKRDGAIKVVLSPCVRAGA
jgi:threonine dehydrogenase-like Zn-dependent dehydrogenase